MKTITINLGLHSYDIAIGEGLLPGIGSACKAMGLGSNVAVVTNPTVSTLYSDVVISALKDAGFSPFVIEIQDGEEYKNCSTLQRIYDCLIDAGMDRRSFIIALGGGVVGDIAGFASATFLRGIPFIQIPTTLLAQVDSSVGGKTGIDHPSGKNLIGAFYQPHLVFSDTGTLKTLEKRHYLAGLAEVVKYGVVLDADLFLLLEAEVEGLLKRDSDLLARIIARCCEIKAAVVEEDEKESGLRAVLNYGHTLGHAFETISGYQGMVHGEAVASGMVQAAVLSASEGYCTETDVQRITLLLQSLKLPVTAPQATFDELVNAISKDKKNRSGSIKFVCNQGIGSHSFHYFTPARLAEVCCSGR